MFNRMSRRDVLRLGIAGAGVATLGRHLPASAQETGRVLKISTLASAAAVNVPLQVALRVELRKQPGFAAAEMQRTPKIPQIAQEVVSGAADMGDADVASTLAAAEAGADLRIIGLSYNNTSQVIVANMDRVKSIEALGQGSTIAVNSVGDFMYVMLQGVFEKRKIPTKQINYIEMGSSGDRARALLAGRVDAVPMHIEQAAQLVGKGNFQVLVKPWEEYDNWFSAVLIARAAWLADAKNADAAVAVIKSTLTAFRKTNGDYEWYKAGVAAHASSNDLKRADDAFLKPVWQTLTTQIKAFPPEMATMTAAEFAKVVPVYKSVGALKGTLDLSKIVDRTYLERAIKELG